MSQTVIDGVTEADAPAPRPSDERRSPLVRFLLADRTARWTSRLVLVLLWQLAGALSPRFPTPVETAQFLVDEFRLPFDNGTWSVWNNELVRNLAISIQRTAIALVIVIAIGLPVGYAMGRWWRVQAFFTDIVTVGLALPLDAFLRFGVFTATTIALASLSWFAFERPINRLKDRLAADLPAPAAGMQGLPLARGIDAVADTERGQ